jgi:mannose-6-phosphate isomerase-like protein (cupin superfamily)
MPATAGRHATTRQRSGMGSSTSTTYKTLKPAADSLYRMNQPVNLSEALASFDQIYSPRIVARVNDYDVRIAHTRGEHVWHVHHDTDEFFLALDGRFDIALRRDHGVEWTVTLHAGDVFVVPRGTEHKPSSPGGAILMFEPTGTSSTGDRHDGAVPDHVDTTTGHPLQ